MCDVRVTGRANEQPVTALARSTDAGLVGDIVCSATSCMELTCIRRTQLQAPLHLGRQARHVVPLQHVQHLLDMPGGAEHGVRCVEGRQPAEHVCHHVGLLHGALRQDDETDRWNFEA